MAPRSFEDIRGWFFWEDTLLFRDVLSAQTAPGTLVELGAFLGKSTALMGYYRGDDRFVVVDLFGAEPGDGANAAENQLSYSTVDAETFRQQFETNYSALHEELPDVVQALSTEVVKHVGPGTVRFAHVDASHLYEHVAEDLRVLRPLMQDDGVIVLDDYRAVHTPGVAAAAWEAVASHGLVPFALSPFKMYATWGSPAGHIGRARRFGAAEPLMDVSEEQILGHTVVRLEKVKTPATAPSLSPADVDRIADKVTEKVHHGLRLTRSRSDYAPPVLVEWVRARRRRG